MSKDVCSLYNTPENNKYDCYLDEVLTKDGCQYTTEEVCRADKRCLYKEDINGDHSQNTCVTRDLLIMQEQAKNICVKYSDQKYWPQDSSGQTVLTFKGGTRKRVQTGVDSMNEPIYDDVYEMDENGKPILKDIPITEENVCDFNPLCTYYYPWDATTNARIVPDSTDRSTGKTCQPSCEALYPPMKDGTVLNCSEKERLISSFAKDPSDPSKTATPDSYGCIPIEWGCKLCPDSSATCGEEPVCLDTDTTYDPVTFEPICVKWDTWKKCIDDNGKKCVTDGCYWLPVGEKGKYECVPDKPVASDKIVSPLRKQQEEGKENGCSPPVSKNDLKDQSVELAKAMGMDEKCVQDAAVSSDTFASAMGGGLNILGGLTSAKVSASVSGTSANTHNRSEGCGNTVGQLSDYSNTKIQQACNLTNINSAVSINLKSEQTIQINITFPQSLVAVQMAIINSITTSMTNITNAAGKPGVLESVLKKQIDVINSLIAKLMPSTQFTDVKLKNTSVKTIKVSSTIDAQQATNLVADFKDEVQKSAETSVKQTLGTGALPPNVHQMIKDNMEQKAQTISEQIASIVNSVNIKDDGKQNVVLNLIPPVILERVTIGNNMVVNAAADSLTKNASLMGQAMASEITSTLLTKTGSDQAVAGADDLQREMGKTNADAIEKTGEMYGSKSMGGMIIGIVVLVLLLGGGGYAYSKSGGGAAGTGSKAGGAAAGMKSPISSANISKAAKLMKFSGNNSETRSPYLIPGLIIGGILIIGIIVLVIVSLNKKKDNGGKQQALRMNSIKKEPNEKLMKRIKEVNNKIANLKLQINNAGRNSTLKQQMRMRMMKR